MCDNEGCVGHGELNFSEKLAEKLTHDIMTYGHSVIGVFDGLPPFSYTAGRAVWGRADLYVNGHIAPATQGLILNDVAKLEDDGKIDLYDLARNGEGIPEVIENFDLKVGLCDPEKAEMTSALMLGCNRAFQLIWPDTEGRYPGDDGYDQRSFHQPLMA